MNWSSIVENNEPTHQNLPIIERKKSISTISDIDYEEEYKTLYELKYNSDIEDFFYYMKTKLNDRCIKILDIHKNSYHTFFDLIYNNTEMELHDNPEDYDTDDDDFIQE